MSRLARLSLAQRSLVTLITLVVAVAGLGAVSSLKQELIPSLAVPQVTVISSYPGASPEVVDDKISQPLSSAMAAVDGLDTVTSTSRNGVSILSVAFEFGTDVDDAKSDVEEAVNGIVGSLPADVDPQVQAGSSDDLPVVVLAVSGSGDLADLGARAEAEAVPALAEIDGVREVEISGVEKRQITITPDVAELTQAGLTTQSITNALEANGIVLPAGSITENGETLSITAGKAIVSVDELADIPLIPTQQGEEARGPVRLGDVATVESELPERTSITRTNGDESLAISVTKTTDGDSVRISHTITDLLPELEDDIGEGTVISVVFDQAPFIETSIHDLTTEGLLGLAFAVVVILIFLLSVRSTLVTAVSIPMSVLITFLGLAAGGHSLNMLTLGALTIAIGRVVDDSIVVIENIKRHLSYGEPKQEAILTAVREVASAITSSTIATVAVFVPIAVVGGLVGELFTAFSITVVIALLASLLVALTIVPVLAYWFLKSPGENVDAEAVRREAEDKERNSVLQRGYVPILEGVLRRPVVTLIAAVVLLGGTIALVPRIQTDFLGDAGQNQLSVTQELPAGTSFDDLTEAATAVEAELLDVDGVETVQVTIGDGSAGYGFFGSNPISFTVTTDADADQQQIQNDARQALRKLTDVGEVTVGAGADGFTGSSSVDVEIEADNGADLSEANDAILEALEDIEGATDVSSDLEAEQPSLELVVDRAEAAEYGLTEAQVIGLVASTLNPQPVGEVRVSGEDLSIYIASESAPETLAELRSFEIATPGGVIELSDIAEVSEVNVPPSISSADGERVVTVSVTPDTDVAVGTLTEAVQAELDDVDLPDDVTATIGGVSADQAESFADLGLALVVAIVIVFFIMVATFRSIVQPIMLLVSIPFAATGSLGLLLLTGTPLGVAGLIGMLMLVGIVVTNAIVLIDLVNQYRAQGQSVHDAVRNGARQRLRPILMTALATIFALTPMALGLTGGGGFISKPLAIVVIGGLITSTALTLILVPVLYQLVERPRERRQERTAAAAHAVREGDDSVDSADSSESAAPARAWAPAPEPYESDDLERENAMLRRMVVDAQLRNAALEQHATIKGSLESGQSEAPDQPDEGGEPGPDEPADGADRDDDEPRNDDRNA